MSIADQIQEQIDHGELPKPISPYIVRLKRIGIWIAVLLAISIGMLSTAIAVWFLTDPQGLLFEWSRSDLWYGIVNALPLFWVLISITAGIVALGIFLHTSQGYRYRTSLIVITVGLSFLAFGGSLYAAGLAEDIEQAAYRFLPGYARIVEPQVQRYHQPDQGKVFGEIRQMKGSMVELADPAGRIWKIQIQRERMEKGMEELMEEDCACTEGIVSTTQNTLTADQIKPCPRALKNRMEALHRRALQQAVKEKREQERTNK